MNEPYREPAAIEPLRRWPLRTSRRYRAGKAVAIGLSVAIPLLFLGRLGRFAGAHPLILLAVLLLGLPAVALIASFVQGRDAETVARQGAELRLYPDRLEVPRPRRDDEGAVDVFPLGDTSIAVDHARMSFNFVVTADVKVAFLVSGERTRRLSSGLFADDEAFEAFVADVRRVQGGHALPPP